VFLRLALLAAIVATTFVAVQQADAWHAVDVQATAKCNVQTGVYDITAAIVQSSDWPGAFVKTVTPATLPGSVAGAQTIRVVIGWAATSETQTFTRTVTLSGQCVVVCVPQVVERVVYVDRPVEVVREVEKRVEVPVVVEKVVEKIVPRTITIVKWRTRTVVKWKTRTVVKWRTKVIHDRCVPPPDEPGCEGKCDWPKKYGGNG
jgi:hypothetical protein